MGGFGRRGGGGRGGGLPIGAGGGIIGLIVVAAIVILPQLLGSSGDGDVDPAVGESAGPTACVTEIEQVVCGAVDDVSLYWERQYP